MRVNIYAEELTDRVEFVDKFTQDGRFTGVRFYLYLPVTETRDHPSGTPMPVQVRGPFLHQQGDDDSAAVTFWGKRDLRKILKKALDLLDEHYGIES